VADRLAQPGPPAPSYALRRARLHLLAALLLAGRGAAAQVPVDLYYQNVPLWSDRSPLSEGGFSDFNRLRLYGDAGLGDFSLGVAYEHAATWREADAGGLFVGAVPGGGEWLDLQWTIEDGEHFLWQHRFDRLEIGWSPSRSLDVSAGRQSVSWATTLFLTPADPFSPFDPADPFRQFRAGVDAVRVRAYPGPLSEVDLVVRGSRTEGLGEELTVLARGLTVLGGWEVSCWGGSLYEEWAGAVATAGSIGATAVRAEAVLRETADGVALRTSVGLDRRFAPGGRTLYLVLEYQRDGLAAAGPDEYPELLASEALRRGELQVLGRDEVALQASYEIDPLWTLSALSLWNPSDGSLLVSPSFSWSAAEEATVSGGIFFGFGDGAPTPARPLPSEYGLAPTTAYLSASLYF